MPRRATITLDVKTLGVEGVDVVDSPLHIPDGGLLVGQNVELSPQSLEGGLQKRSGMSLHSATQAAGELLGIETINLRSTGIALLGEDHLDVFVTDPNRGDLITAQRVDPIWMRLPKGNATDLLEMVDGDPVWTAFPAIRPYAIGSAYFDDLSVAVPAGTTVQVPFGTQSINIGAVFATSGADYIHTVPTTQPGVYWVCAQVSWNASPGMSMRVYSGTTTIISYTQPSGVTDVPTPRVKSVQAFAVLAAGATLALEVTAASGYTGSVFGGSSATFLAFVRLV